MNFKLIITVVTLLTGMATTNNLTAQDINMKDFDKRGIEVVQKFIDAINANPGDENAAATAALPFIHRSEYNATQDGLKQDRMDFSFKKAWQNVNFYQSPVKITRIQKQALTGIGFGETAQLGIAYKVFLAKKADVKGLPAAVHVFFPNNGSEPKIYYYGSF